MKSNVRPKISVITAVYNGKDTILEAIKSVYDSGLSEVEHIIVDGGSNDGTIEILESNNDLIDTWISEPDSGIYDAWNKGIGLARGDWICFLGCDDVFFDNGLERYLDYINNNEDINFISSKVELVGSGKVYRVIGRAFDKFSIESRMSIAHVGSMHHSSLFEDWGFFNTNYKIIADYEFLLRVRNVIMPGFIPVVTARMAVNGVSNENPDIFKELIQLKKSYKLGGPINIYCSTILAKIKWRLRKIIWY